MKFPAPKKYEKILDGIYEEWRIPLKSKDAHGEIIFDTDKSYKEYI